MPYKAQIQATLGGAAKALAEYLAALNSHSPLALWDAGAGVYSDAGTTPAAPDALVAQLNDQSGNGLHVSQGTDAQKPAYRASVAALNNRPALQFDGGDYMLLALSGGILAAMGNNYAVVAVYTTTNEDVDVVYSEGNSGSVTPAIVIGKNADEGATHQHRDDANANRVTASTAGVVAKDGTMVLQTNLRNGASDYAIRIDNVEVASNTVPIVAGATTITHISIGARYSGGIIITPHIGHLAHVSLYANAAAALEAETILEGWYRPA